MRLRGLTTTSAHEILFDALQSRRLALAQAVLARRDLALDVGRCSDDLGESLLHVAAAAGSVACCAALLDRGAQCSTIDATRGTPLHTASDEGCTDVIVLLLERGKADVNCVDMYGNTPLHRAGECYEFLVSFSFDLLLTINSSQNYFDHAASEGHRDALKALLKHGANVRATNCDQCTPLHKAASVHGAPGGVAVRLLLAAGAAINATDQHRYETERKKELFFMRNVQKKWS